MDYIKFYTIYSDTVHLDFSEPFEESYSFFNDIELNDNFQQDFKCEKETVRFFFNSKNVLHGIMNDIFGFTPSQYLYEKAKPFFENKSKGELDLILCNANIAESIQIEFKRIFDKKESSIYIDKEKLNKLAEQANRNYNLGFHKVYVVVVIDVKGFKLRTPNIFYRDVSMSDLKKINNALNSANLNQSIGIIFLENISTSGKPIEMQRGIMIGVYKEAVGQKQHPEISENIEKSMKHIQKSS